MGKKKEQGLKGNNKILELYVNYISAKLGETIRVCKYKAKIPSIIIE